MLGVKIEPASDKWDRLFNVDFFILVNGKYIGLQVKPVNSGIQLPAIFKEKEIQAKSHEKFTAQYGGKVFYVYSTQQDGKKKIVNTEVVDEIQAEIKRLS
jgi:hypothetical protein